MISNTLTVNQTNFQEILETTVLARVEFKNFTSGFISKTDTSAADTGTQLLQKLIDVIVQSDNSVSLMIQPTFTRLGLELDIPVKLSKGPQNGTVTPFEIQIPKMGHFYDMCQSTVAPITDKHAFLAASVYR